MTFPELTPEAQSAIVCVIMGEPVPSLPESVRAEIKAWAETDEKSSTGFDGMEFYGRSR